VKKRGQPVKTGGGIARGARTLSRLSDRAVRAFVAKRRAGQAVPTKLSDGGGLYLMMTPAGTAVWRLKYRLGGKEKLYAVGVYPGVGLEAARAEREAVKAYLREGRDPVKAWQLGRAAMATASDTTFDGVASDWLARRKRDWSSVHYDTSRRALDRDVLPFLGRLPVSDITPAMVARVIEAVTRRGAHDTAGRTLQHVTCVFRLAQARGLRSDNPAVPVREVLARRKPVQRRPALLEIPALQDFLRRAELAPLSPAVRQAHRLCAFTAARIGNVGEAQWPEFDLDADITSWTIPRAKMKARARPHDHKVLLGPTIARELRDWRALTGGVGHLFPSPTGGPYVTREAIEKAYRQTLGMAGKHSPHGWRAAFATLARDAGFAREVVELTLDHIHDNAVARAYDRGQRLIERRQLMDWWDATLTGTPPDANVLPLRKAGAR
jgi:integrase